MSDQRTSEPLIDPDPHHGSGVDPDAAALERLWRQHATAVLRYASRRVRAADVDEVVAETFVVAWRRLADVPDPALPWLLGVARGVAANTTRAATRRNALESRVAAEPNPVLEQARAVDDKVIRALRQLSDTDQELLTLIAWDGLTPIEAAIALGCSRSTLAVRLYRARSRLRRELERAATTDTHIDATLEEPGA